jgi:hypothetical protein
MRKLIWLSSVLFAVNAFAASATFTAMADTTDVPNPERGFYSYPYYSNSTLQSMRTPANWASDIDSGVVGRGYRLAYAVVSLDDTISAPIAAGTLTNLQTSFDSARAKGVKVILRFAYNYSGNDAQASLSQILSHITQLRPLFYANRDIIYLVHAGFLGNYGEWWWNDKTNGYAHYTETLIASRTSVRNALINAVPPEIPIGITCMPCHKDVWASSPISSTTAFNGSTNSRVGHHNDCFMASTGDSFNVGSASGAPFNDADIVGVSTGAQFRQYLTQMNQYIPYGGETCSGAAMRSGCTSTVADNSGGLYTQNGIMNEGPRYRLAYLGRDYYSGLVGSWTSCMSNVTNLMGYRFQLAALSHADAVNRGSSITFTATIRNVGWARIFSPRRMRVVLVNGGSTITGYSNQQLRQVPEQTTATTIFNAPVTIPANATTGSWTVNIDFPDTPANETSQAGSSAKNFFKIRPANSDNGGQVWDATNYRFTTGTTVTVN